MRENLIGRIGKGGGSHDWVSRDYAITIPCQCTACPVNRDYQCTAPAVIKIDAGGQCETGRAFKEKPVVQNAKPRCKWCGGLIWANQATLQWEHVGEKLSHPAEPR